MKENKKRKLSNSEILSDYISIISDKRILFIIRIN